MPLHQRRDFNNPIDKQGGARGVSITQLESIAGRGVPALDRRVERRRRHTDGTARLAWALLDDRLGPGRVDLHLADALRARQDGYFGRPGQVFVLPAVQGAMRTTARDVKGKCKARHVDLPR